MARGNAPLAATRLNLESTIVSKTCGECRLKAGSVQRTEVHLRRPRTGVRDPPGGRVSGGIYLSVKSAASAPRILAHSGETVSSKQRRVVGAESAKSRTWHRRGRLTSARISATRCGAVATLLHADRLAAAGTKCDVHRGDEPRRRRLPSSTSTRRTCASIIERIAIGVPSVTLTMSRVMYSATLWALGRRRLRP